MSQHTGRLVLTPKDPLLAPSAERLGDELTAIGLLGQRLLENGHAFQVGPDFFALLTFAGCAVQLETRPQETAATPRVRVCIDGPSTIPRLWVGRNTRPPRCPVCRALLRTWRDRIHTDDPQSCPDCQASHPLTHWDWREHGGAGRLFVCIEGVFPGEAVPTPALMRHLQRQTKSDWRHFSIQDH